jgi:hypothetical protein
MGCLVSLSTGFGDNKNKKDAKSLTTGSFDLNVVVYADCSMLFNLIIGNMSLAVV